MFLICPFMARLEFDRTVILFSLNCYFSNFPFTLLEVSFYIVRFVIFCSNCYFNTQFYIHCNYFLVAQGVTPRHLGGDPYI